MGRQLHILLVEDSEDDAMFMIRELQRGGYEPIFQRVDTAPGFNAALAAGGWDVVIADYNLPEFSGVEALGLLQRSGIDLPFIIVSGAIGEEVAVAVMKSGAHDYILKSGLARLVPAVEREIRDAQGRHERRQAETCIAALSKLGHDLSAATTPIEAARVIGNIAEEMFNWDAFTLDLYDSERAKIETVLNIDTINGEKQDVPSTYASENPSSTSRRVIDCGAELILKDDVTTMLSGSIPLGNTTRPSASLMFVPIRNQTRVIGVLSLHSYQPLAYDQKKLGTFQMLADYCGGALERMRAREELKNSREQLRALAAHLQSVREEERKRITREIHDEMGQSLTGLKMDLAWIRTRLQSTDEPLNRTPLFDKLNVMGALLDGTAGLVRKLCTELRPGILDDLGLTAALEWQAREFERRTGIVCKTKLELGELTVDSERSTALFRIFQEILTNVARHAHASRIDVRLKPAGREVVMEVADNGRGITETEQAGVKSLGLLGMRERAHILGGLVEIRGAPGKGTTVSVKVPLPEFSRKISEPTRGANRVGAENIFAHEKPNT